MDVRDNSKQGDGFCGVCGSPASIQPRYLDKECSLWYTTRLEWALESFVPAEWICDSCDRLLKTADQLEIELSDVLTTLCQRHKSLKQLGSNTESTETAGSLLRQKLNGSCSDQANGMSFGAGDMLISIWTEQQASPQPDDSKQNVSMPVKESGQAAESQVMKNMKNGTQKKCGREEKDKGPKHSTDKHQAKMTVCLSCDDCSRTFGTVSTLARHRKRAHRGKAKNDIHRTAIYQHTQEPVPSSVVKGTTVGNKNNGETQRTEMGPEQRVTPAESKADQRLEANDIEPSRHESALDNNTELLASQIAVTKVTKSRYRKRHSPPSDTMESSGGMKRDGVDPAVADPVESLPVVRGSPWLRSDAQSVETDGSVRHSATAAPMLSGLETEAPHSPTSAAFSEPAELGSEHRLQQPHSEGALESLGGAGGVLEHGEFPYLSVELPSELPGTGAAGASASATTTAANEDLSIAHENNHELFISFDAELEHSHSATSNVPQTSYSDDTANQKLENTTVTKTDNFCLVGSKNEPPPGLHDASEEMTAEVKKMSAENANSASSELEKKSVSGSRRPWLSLYERHGQKWRCRHCSALFASRTGVHSHALTHIDPDGGRCPRCGKTYANAYALRRHRSGCLSGRPPSCPICGKIVADAAYLAQHVRNHSEDVPKKHQCDRCGLAFATGARLRQHIAVKHSGETPYRCDICRREFKLQVHLRRHCRSVHGASPAVTCEICGKGFNRADHLRAHMTVHTGARPFVCKECGRGFTRADTLADHVRLHTGERPYKCDECGEVFREHRAHRRHVKLKHGEKKTGQEAGAVAG